MLRFFMRFPEGRKKAFTLSYDDGVKSDIRFLEIINKYGLKSTFNLNAGIAKTNQFNRLSLDECSCYEGHEIATHGYTHPFLSHLPPEVATYEIARDRMELEENLGRIIRGHAYANGAYDEKSKEILKNTGIEYARGVKSTHNFSIPKDFLEWQPTCHHSDEKLFDLIKEFLVWSPSGESLLFYLWGHTYEFDSGKERNNWEHADEFCSKIAGHEDTVWYATNIEICDYINAYKQLRFSMNARLVYNPTCTDLWIGPYASEESVKIPKGETVRI
ncbi:MAG: polysaccharide deacetylase family protein [Clostridia bacterium]|nr:polysaccharide deacetylase family protein [Clostridia bacterium]